MEYPVIRAFDINNTILSSTIIYNIAPTCNTRRIYFEESTHVIELVTGPHKEADGSFNIPITGPRKIYFNNHPKYIDFRICCCTCAEVDYQKDCVFDNVTVLNCQPKHSGTFGLINKTDDPNKYYDNTCDCPDVVEYPLQHSKSQ